MWHIYLFQDDLRIDSLGPTFGPKSGGTVVQALGVIPDKDISVRTVSGGLAKKVKFWK